LEKRSRKKREGELIYSMVNKLTLEEKVGVERKRLITSRDWKNGVEKKGRVNSI